MQVSNRRFRLPFTIILLAAAWLPAGPVPGATPRRPDGTRRMVELLDRITSDSDPDLNPFMNAAHVARLQRLRDEVNAEAGTDLLEELAREQLNAGFTNDAIATLGQVEGRMRAKAFDPRSRQWTELRVKQAVAHLRLGEDRNCILHHNARSCIFPVQGTGVHVEQSGSREAAAILAELLRQNPADLRARWLLNIAYMTLGEYPDGVPASWVLSPELFRSEYDIGSFKDVAGKLGLDVDDNAGGVIMEDFDGDGDLDLMTSAMGLRSQLRYFRNEGDGTFGERTGQAGLTGLFGGLNLVQTDYDNDGRPDALVLRGAWMGREGRYPNSLLRNDGDGTFTDVTEQAGLLSFHPTQTAVWLDFDGDGWLDLFIGNESSPGDPHACELYRNNGDGSFTECAREAGVAVTAFVKAVASADYDNDGRPDLYLSVQGGPNLLFHNDGPAGFSAGAPLRGRPWRFTERAAEAGVTEPFCSFPAWFWDYDNDGWEDLFVGGYQLDDVGDVAADVLGLPHAAELPRLYRNNHDGTFADVTRLAHLDRLLLAMGSNYGDLDNDGWLDFYVGTGNPDLGMLLPDRMFRNAEGRFFQDVTTSGGFGHLQKGHAIAFGDLDNDGDQDIYHVVGGAFEADHFRNALFENPGHGNHWIVLRLEGVRSNRAAIGARIKVVVRTAGGERAIYRTVRSGGSFGASPLRQEIGLGAAMQIVRAGIVWPSGGPAQNLEGLELDHRYLVREGAPAAPIRLNGFRLGGGPGD